MRFFFIWISFSLLNLLSAHANTTQTVDVEVIVSGIDESQLKKQAFDQALTRASTTVVRKFVTEAEQYKVDAAIAETDLRKFFKNVDVIANQVTHKEFSKEFAGSFRFEFKVADIEAMLERNEIEFQHNLTQKYKIVQIPVFIEDDVVYHWFDSKLSDIFLANTKTINSFSIALLEPTLSAVRLDLLSKLRLHHFAEQMQKSIDYDGYNLIICTMSEESGVLNCENNLIYNDVKKADEITLKMHDITEDGRQLVSEINTVFSEHGTKITDHTLAKPTHQSKRYNGLSHTIPVDNVNVKLHYDKLSDVMRFQKLLTQNPYILHYKVQESGFGKTAFTIQIRGGVDSMKLLMAENNLEQHSVQDVRATAQNTEMLNDLSIYFTK